MYIKSYDQFFSQVEDLLQIDPFTSRLVVKYCQKRRVLIMSLRSDKKVITHAVMQKDDAKKVESVMHKCAEVYTNRKSHVEKMALEGIQDHGTGKKGKKKRN